MLRILVVIEKPGRPTSSCLLSVIMWIKHVILELAVTLMIALATIPDLVWARWIVIIYTGLMLVLKIVALIGGRLLQSIRQPSTDVPAWFWHANYAANVLLLALDEWWYMVGAWVAIWIVSVAYDQQVGMKTRS